jgi:hypothetical protein
MATDFKPFPILDNEWLRSLGADEEQNASTDPSMDLFNQYVLKNSSSKSDILAPVFAPPSMEPVEEEAPVAAPPVPVVQPKAVQVPSIAAKRPEAGLEPLSRMFGTDQEDALTKAAMKRRDDLQFAADMSRVGTGLAEAFSRGAYKGDDALAKSLEARASQSLGDIDAERKAKTNRINTAIMMQQLNDKVAKADPTSPVSATYRQMYKQATGDSIPETASADDVLKLYPLIETRLKRETLAEARREKETVKKEMEAVKQTDKLAKDVANYAKKTINSIHVADQFAEEIQNYRNDPSFFRSIMARYGFAKSNDPESAVREHELNLLMGGAWVTQAKNFMTKAMNGRVQTNEQIAELQRIAKEMQANAVKRHHDMTKPIYNRALKQKVPLQDIDPFYGRYEALKGDEDGEVGVRLSDGSLAMMTMKEFEEAQKKDPNIKLLRKQ